MVTVLLFHMTQTRAILGNQDVLLNLVLCVWSHIPHKIPAVILPL